jgi:hypothetical protein
MERYTSHKICPLFSSKEANASRISFDAMRSCGGSTNICMQYAVCGLMGHGCILSTDHS